MWKITLSDGSIIENLKLNGNNFISQTQITEDMFKDKLSKVIFEGELNGQPFYRECNNMELVQIAHYEDGYYFILRELSQDELYKINLDKTLNALLGVE